MFEVVVGAILATALIYIGRCWGRQERTQITVTLPRRQRPQNIPPWAEQELSTLGRTSGIRRDGLWHTGEKK